MDPISGTDRLVLLLRQKLLERSKGAKASRSNGKPSASETTSEPTGIQAMAALEGADDRSLRRALIQHLLADQLGPGLLNETQFQQIVSRVTDAIDEDPATSKLLTRVIADLRSV